ncbi:enoyl-CoA hydratase/isomerase [Phlyctema vagabunda]|uniref:Enoyl-CoA hydratase/isomerase n=1 Tax=Phlyctema vagabunda TaxID=108571 RepID=A0ABR4PVF8_9HELO
MESFHKPAPTSPSFLLSYPRPHILLITIDRARSMNAIPMAAHWEAEAILDWFDSEPQLRVAVLTGAGTKAFSAGQDLMEQVAFQTQTPPPRLQDRRHPPAGFLGLSRRVGKKPIVAAVNGFALGGGFETCLNCDLVIASPEASFGLPETGVGLYAAAGGLPRLVRSCGIQLASEIAMTGRRLTSAEALSLHLINQISATPASVVDESLAVAEKIARMSPDAIIVTRHGLREAWAEGSVERAYQRTAERFDRLLFEGENTKIGIRAFGLKERPVWVPSKL